MNMYTRYKRKRNPRIAKSRVKEDLRESIHAFLRDMRDRGDALAYVPDPQEKRHYRGPLSEPTHVTALALYEGFLGFSSWDCTKASFLAHLNQSKSISGQRSFKVVTRDIYGNLLYTQHTTTYPVSNFY